MDGIRHHQSMRYNNIMTLHYSRRETTLWLTSHSRNLACVPFGHVTVKDGCIRKHVYRGWNTPSSKHEIKQEYDTHWSRREATLWLTTHIRNLTGVPLGQVTVKDECISKHPYNGWNTTSSSMIYYNMMTLHQSIRRETTLWLTTHIRNLACVPIGQVTIKDECGVKHDYNGWKYDIIKAWDITA
jgi:hypothetical protein